MNYAANGPLDPPNGRYTGGGDDECRTCECYPCECDYAFELHRDRLNNE